MGDGVRFIIGAGRTLVLAKHITHGPLHLFRYDAVDYVNLFMVPESY